MIVEQLVYFPSLSGGREARAISVILCKFSDKAESFIRSTRHNTKNRFSIVGIVDDAKMNSGRTIQGVKVLGSLETLDAVIAKLKRRGSRLSSLL